MNASKRVDCILVNTDCVASIQNFDGKAMKVTLQDGEQMIIPATAFGTCIPLTTLPQIVPFSRMVALIKNGEKTERRPIQLMAVMGRVLQPVCIDMGEISYPVGIDGYVGMEIGSDYIVSLGEINV